MKESCYVSCPRIVVWCSRRFCRMEHHEQRTDSEVINIYNNNIKKARLEEAEARIREKEQIRRIRAEARRKQNKKHKQKNK